MIPFLKRPKSWERMCLAFIIVLTIVFWVRVFKMAFKDDNLPTDYVSDDYKTSVFDEMIETETINGTVCPTSNPALGTAAKKLKDVLKLMQKHPISTEKRLLLPVEERLENLVLSLDTTYTIEESSKGKEFCPEHFTNVTKEEDYYYISGSWVSEKCPNLLPLPELVSVILYANEDGESEDNCPTKYNRLLKMIQSTHPGLKVYIALDPLVCNTKALPDVYVLEVNPSVTDGDVWHNLVLKVKTPYVLIGRGLDYFSELAQIRRQLSILASDKRVQVVGGSIRNLTGHWRVGCYQTTLRNYILEYDDGYYASKHECLFCDHLLGPFITETALIRNTRLNEFMTESVLFEDWFLRIKKKKVYLVMNCPDAMYFSTDAYITRKETDVMLWLPLAKVWALNRIILPENVKLSISCEDSGLECPYINSMAGKKMLPICCIDKFAAAMRVFHDLCESNKLLYNCIGVFVLGAVKLRDIIPWNFDYDVDIYSSDKDFFWTWGHNQVKLEKDVFIENVGHNLSLLWSPDMFVTLWPMERTAADVFMPEVFISVPTRIKIHGVWVYGPPSPGLHARNMYGNELLKHTDSWHHTGKWSWKDQYNGNGHFQTCEEPDHHACPVNFFTDGSFQFEIP